MSVDRGTEEQPAVERASPGPTGKAGRMRAAIDEAVAAGPGFLRGDVNADQMANAMVAAVRNYVEHESATGSDRAPLDGEAQDLQDTLAELMACGSGYLAGRCDAACVARTMTQMVREFDGH